MFSALAAAVPAALSFFGGELANRRQADQAEAANAFSAQQYATRYQTTVADMKAAGINPMLAYGSGPGQAPTGQQAQVTNSGRDVGALAMQGRLNEAQVDLLQAQANQANSAAALARDQMSSGGLGASTVQFQGSSAALNAKQIEQVDANVRRIEAEIPLLHQQSLSQVEQQKVYRQTVQMLADQAALMAEQGNTQYVVRDHLKAQIRKLLTETNLNQLDLDAAEFSGNFGRNANEFRMVEEILSDMVPNLGKVFGKSKPRKGWSSTERSDGKGNRSIETREWSEQ